MAKRMLPVPHFQVVCTLPFALRAVARARPAEVYGLLMQTAARVLKELVAERHGVRPGLTVVLHTWTTTLEHHPHVHLLVSAGGLDPDDAWRGIEGDYLLPQRKLGACFRGALLRALIDDVGNWELPWNEALRHGTKAPPRRTKTRDGTANALVGPFGPVRCETTQR